MSHVLPPWKTGGPAIFLERHPKGVQKDLRNSYQLFRRQLVEQGDKSVALHASDSCHLERSRRFAASEPSCAVERARKCRDNPRPPKEFQPKTTAPRQSGILASAEDCPETVKHNRGGTGFSR